MKITHIDCTPFDLPLVRPVAFSGGKLSVTEHVLVEVRTDEGLTGTAEAPSRPFFYGESQQSMVAAVEQWFGPALAGMDPFSAERAWEVFAKVEHNNTIKGAIDIALHDIMGQALGQPCHKLLGGYATRARMTYICGYGEPAAMVGEALSMRSRYGITSFKFKVGAGDPRQDIEMLRTTRRELPDALLYVDGNSGLSGFDGVRVLQEAAAQGFAWAEEPVHRDDRTGRQLVARSAGLPIMGDESCRTPGEVAREIADGNVHMVGIKTARSGFRLSRDILGQCAATRTRNIVISQGDSDVGILAGLNFCVAHRATQSLPAELSFHLNLGDGLLAVAPKIKEGWMEAGDAPGLGILIDKAKLERYRKH